MASRALRLGAFKQEQGTGQDHSSGDRGSEIDFELGSTSTVRVLLTIAGVSAPDEAKELHDLQGTRADGHATTHLGTEAGAA